MNSFAGLRSRFILIITLAALPLLLMAIQGYRQEYVASLEGIDRDIQQTLHAVLLKEGDVSDTIRTTLSIMSRANEMKVPTAESCSGLAQRLMQTHTRFANIGAAWPDGSVYCSARPFSQPVSVADREWFRQAITQRVPGKGHYLKGRISGEATIAYAYPQDDGHGAVKTVLFASVPVDWFKQAMEGVEIPADWHAAVVSVDGTVIAEVSPSAPHHHTTEEVRQLIGTPPEQLEVKRGALEHGMYLIGLAPLPSVHGLYVLVGVDTKLTVEPVTQRFRMRIAVIVGIALASFLLAMALIRRDFVVWASRMIELVSRLGSGELAARGGRLSTITELQTLTDHVDAMAARLEISHDNLMLSAKVFETSDEGIVICDADNKILTVNPHFCAATGYTADEVRGRNPHLLKSGVHDAEFYRQMWQSIELTGGWRGEITNRRKDGTLYSEWLSISTMKDPAGRINHYVGIFSDAPERRQLDERMQHLSQHDALTDLPNRSLLTDRVDQAIVTADRYKRSLALLVIDLVHFRRVNDAVGLRGGDAALIEAAHRLENLVRPGDTVARIGADEFALILANLDREQDVIHLARRILDLLAEPVVIDGKRISLAANLGVALYPENARNAEGLFKAAEAALERARRAGSDTFRFFSADMDEDAALRLHLEADLRGAQERGEIEVHYQPQISLVSGAICGYEALVRWQHPELGMISPARFVPIAEETGLIDTIGAWVLKEACRQNKRWIDAGHPLQPVAVNVSARQFRHTDLVALVRDTLAATGLPGDGLELEITESVFLDDVDRIVHVLEDIKRLGVLLALDDFGTGYSSLSHLSRLPFDKIKIDQAFIRDITMNPVNAAIVNATIAMGRSLNMTVLAEGVENEAQLEFLRKQHGEAMQGWLFSKALPASEVTALLVERRVLKVGANDMSADTLLIVDDEVNILNALKRLLRREPYRVLVADSPAAAFDLLARNSVQVVISDQRMPEMHGTEFLARVKQIYPGTVRIVLSGYTDLESLTEAINRGAIYRFLVKPWNDDELRQNIREAFRVAHGHASH